MTRTLTWGTAFAVCTATPLLSGCGGTSGLQWSISVDGGDREGGRVEDQPDAGIEGRDASVEPVAMTMAPAPDASAETSTRCTMAPNPGGGGVYGAQTAACTIMWQETCDGTPYYATCACPQGTCGCVGPTTSVSHSFQFQGCTDCYAVSPSDVLALCGFPQ